MSNKIRNYKDLQEEEERLLTLLKLQKMRLEADIAELKNEARPVINVFSFAGKLTTRDNSHSMINAVVDLLIARMFAKSSFLVWLIFPTLISNLSSHYIPKLIPKLRHLIGKMQKDGEIPAEDSPDFIPVMPHENGHKEKVPELQIR